ncbi:anhydro-N-acetylmuramic acid kinase, partial [bacterium]|nr:anhydro-N-acetylmuramic acid kinase [bacterium]
MKRKTNATDLVIGLMSGTSCDGIDAALVAVRGHGLHTRVRLVAFETVPYPASVRRLIAQVSDAATGTVDLVCRANVLLGELFAEAATAVAAQAGVDLRRVSLIGSHGQTIHHLPKARMLGGRRVAATLQIGEPSVIAERTGVTTVADFRPRDMACGGQGAPLVPYVDYLLFRHRSRGRLLLNIGGIANVTYLPPACRPTDVLAFDTGPGNMVVDALVARLTRGRERFDRGGQRAARGTLDAGLLKRLLRHSFLRQRPPKSTGREMFGAAFADALVRDCGGCTD